MVNPFWKSLFPLLCILVIDAMSFGIVIPILGPMLLEPSSTFLPAETPLATRTLYYSLCLGLPTAFMFIGAPLLGDFSDSIGRKKALFIAMIGITVSCLISAGGVMIGSVFLLLVGRSALGFMDGSESVAKAAIADLSTHPKQKVLNLSLASVAGTGGFVFGPMIGGLISIHQLSYLAPFLFAALLALINAVVLSFLFKETYVPPAVKRKVHLLNSFKNLIMAFTDKRIRLLSIIFFCMQFVWGIYFQSITILLVKAFHFDAQQVGFYLSFLSLCFVITLSVIIRILLHFLNQKTIVILSLILLLCGSLTISFWHTELSIWLSVIPLCMGVGLNYNTVLGLFSDAVDKDNQGRIMGIAVAIFSVAWVFSSIIGGLMSPINLYIPYFIAAGVACIGLGAACCVKILKAVPEQSS